MNPSLKNNGSNNLSSNRSSNKSSNRNTNAVNIISDMNSNNIANSNLVQNIRYPPLVKK